MTKDTYFKSNTMTFLANPIIAASTVLTTTILSVCNFINPVMGTVVIVLVGYYSIKHHRNRTIKDELEIERMKKKDASND
jgi:hypothetical protein